MAAPPGHDRRKRARAEVPVPEVPGSKAIERSVRLFDATARALTRCAAEERNLTREQVLSLRAIADAPRCTVSMLSRALSVRVSTATRNLSVLARRGLVSRVRDPLDARVVVVSLTDEGKAAAAAVSSAEREWLERTLARIPDRRDEVVEAIEALAAALEVP